MKVGTNNGKNCLTSMDFGLITWSQKAKRKRKGDPSAGTKVL